MSVVAQICYSLQFVYEEKILSQNEIQPLQTVGLEGFYGLIIMSILLVPLAYIDAGSELWSSSHSPPYVLEDPIDGFIQLGNSKLLLVLFCAYTVAISFKLYGGVAVIKEFGATTRIVLDVSTSLIVWGISLSTGWEQFQYIELIGLFVMIAGIFAYNWKRDD